MYYKVLKPYTYLDNDNKIQTLDTSTVLDVTDFTKYNLNYNIIRSNPIYFQILQWEDYITEKYSTTYNKILYILSESDLDAQCLINILEAHNLLYYDIVYDLDNNLGVIQALLKNGNYDLKVGYKTDCYNEIEKRRYELTKLKKDAILKWNSTSACKYKFIRFIKSIDFNCVVVSIYDVYSNVPESYKIMTINEFFNYTPIDLNLVNLSAEDSKDKFFNNNYEDEFDI